MSILTVFLNIMPFRLISSFTLIAVVLIGFLMPAKAQNFEGKKISAVEIHYRGAETVEENVLRKHISCKVGEKFQVNNMDKDITALYESGLIDDVAILAEPKGEKEVKLVFEVATRPLCNAIKFAGSKAFPVEKLAKEAGMKAGDLLTNASILDARRKLVDFYHASGYPDVEITPELRDCDKDGFADLALIIQEGKKNGNP